MLHLLLNFIEVNYRSVYATHKQLIPTRAPASPSPGVVPDYTSWGGASLPGIDFLDDIVGAQQAFFLDTTVFESAIFWATLPGDTKPSAISAHTLGAAGDSTYTGWAEAVQRTWSFKTSGFNIFKIVQLDTPTSNNFGRYTGSLDTPGDAFVDYLLGDTTAVAGRDTLRPVAFWSLTLTLNEKLRRQYHLT